MAGTTLGGLQTGVTYKVTLRKDAGPAEARMEIVIVDGGNEYSAVGTGTSVSITHTVTSIYGAVIRTRLGPYSNSTMSGTVTVEVCSEPYPQNPE